MDKKETREDWEILIEKAEKLLFKIEVHNCPCGLVDLEDYIDWKKVKESRRRLYDEDSDMTYGII